MRPAKTSTDLGDLVEAVRREISLAGRRVARMRGAGPLGGQSAMVVEQVVIELPLSLTFSEKGPQVGTQMPAGGPGLLARITVTIVPKGPEETSA